MMYRPHSGTSFGFRLSPAVQWLLLLNTGLFILSLFYRDLVLWLGLVPGAVLQRPWTLLTYAFVHGGVGHFLFNMLALFFFGMPLEERWDARTFLAFYALCAAGGAVASFVFPHTLVIGASAAIYGVLVAFAWYWPTALIYVLGIFPVQARWLVAILIGLTVLFSLAEPGSGIAHLAHLGGIVAAAAYLGAERWRLLRSGQRDRQRRLWAETLRSLLARHRGGQATTTPADERLFDDVDRILDKISRHGLASLTPEERRKLEEASRRLESSSRRPRR